MSLTTGFFLRFDIYNNILLLVAYLRNAVGLRNPVLKREDFKSVVEKACLNEKWVPRHVIDLPILKERRESSAAASLEKNKRQDPG